MCFNEFGVDDPGSMQWNCTARTHFVCNQATYFDAKIGAGQGRVVGSPIDRDWNGGECYNRFIVNYACRDTTPPTVKTPTQELSGGRVVRGKIPVTFRWGAKDASGVRSFEVWLIINGSGRKKLAATTGTSARWL